MPQMYKYGLKMIVHFLATAYENLTAILPISTKLLHFKASKVCLGEKRKFDILTHKVNIFHQPFMIISILFLL